MERPVNIEYNVSLMRTVYRDQCWEVDPGRTVLTQYIARNPHAIRATFRAGDIIKIGRTVYAIGDTLIGYFGVNDCEWCVTTICYFLKPFPFDMGPPMLDKLVPLPGNIIEPAAIPSTTTGALHSPRVKADGELCDLNAEMDEARDRYKLVVAELEKVRN